MILSRLEITAEDLERRTGWAIRPEGACKGGTCVPLPPADGSTVDARVIAERLHMPLIGDEVLGVWCLGPQPDGKVLSSAQAPELNLPEWRGGAFTLSSLRGRRVLLLAWASW